VNTTPLTGGFDSFGLLMKARSGFTAAVNVVTPGANMINL
jgi:hypothetical protein